MVVLVFSMNYDLQHKERDSSYGSLMKKSIKLLSSKEILGPSFLISSMLAVEA
jgi:hypothetical protein